MTPEPEMTLESAKELIEKYEGAQSRNREKYHRRELCRASSFIAGHAAGLKESQALVKELVAVVKDGITYGYGSSEYKNKLRAALESARRMA